MMEEQVMEEGILMVNVPFEIYQAGERAIATLVSIEAIISDNRIEDAIPVIRAMLGVREVVKSE